MKKLKADIDEMSTSGASGGYNTPYAFRLPGSKPNDKEMLDLGYTPVKEALSGDKIEALLDLQGVLDRAAQLGEEARSIFQDHFPSELKGAEAYDIFNFGSSANQYDNTLRSFITSIEQEYARYDEDELDETMQGTNRPWPMSDATKARKEADKAERAKEKEDEDELDEDLSAYKETPMKMGHLDTNDDGVKKPIYFNYGYKLVDKSKS
tara:strand:+ start:1102 stop:1728 length:627 start_codon:yes stop_codon:yes gene_type:complete